MAIELKRQLSTPARAISFGDIFEGLTRQKISAKDRRFFTEQLSLLLSTGTNLHASLQTLKGSW